MESTVFATSDYDRLALDPHYLQAVKYIFTSCTVVFLGYSVRDDYVIRLLEQNQPSRSCAPSPTSTRSYFRSSCTCSNCRFFHDRAADMAVSVRLRGQHFGQGIGGVDETRGQWAVVSGQ